MSALRCEDSSDLDDLAMNEPSQEILQGHVREILRRGFSKDDVKSAFPGYKGDLKNKN